MVDGGAQAAGISISALCQRRGMSRQNYYAVRRQRQRRQVDEALVVELVRQERQIQPRVGTRKLRHLLEPKLAEAGVELGRDRFFEVLRSHDLLVERKRSWPKTTNSRHALPVFHNLVAGREPTGPNQIWVSDLTYIRTDEGFLYAAVVMDRFSRKIVGKHMGDSLEAIGCVKALELALAVLPAEQHPIHHSDRGIQYACREYVELLQGQGLMVSMSRTGNPYDNAFAESFFKTLKYEEVHLFNYETYEDVLERIPNFIEEVYNRKRLHSSIGYLPPEEFEKEVAGKASNQIAVKPILCSE